MNLDFKPVKSLGNTLKGYRELMNLTLRQVEDVTGISNAYLSQLENDRIKNPSANVLYKLASLYHVELDTLLVASGIITKNAPQKNKLFNTIAFSAESLTEEDEQELLNYLRFLRHQKNA